MPLRIPMLQQGSDSVQVLSFMVTPSALYVLDPERYQHSQAMYSKLSEGEHASQGCDQYIMQADLILENTASTVVTIVHTCAPAANRCGIHLAS